MADKVKSMERQLTRATEDLKKGANEIKAEIQNGSIQTAAVVLTSIRLMDASLAKVETLYLQLDEKFPGDETELGPESADRETNYESAKALHREVSRDLLLVTTTEELAGREPPVEVSDPVNAAAAAGKKLIAKCGKVVKKLEASLMELQEAVGSTVASEVLSRTDELSEQLADALE